MENGKMAILIIFWHKYLAHILDAWIQLKASNNQRGELRLSQRSCVVTRHSDLHEQQQPKEWHFMFSQEIEPGGAGMEGNFYFGWILWYWVAEVTS